MAGSSAAAVPAANDSFIGAIQASTRSRSSSMVAHALVCSVSAWSCHRASHSLGS